MTPLPEKNTIVILDSCGQDPIRFYELQGDYSKWDKTLLNASETDEDLEDEISSTLYGVPGWSEPLPYTEEFPTLDVDGANTVVIIITFLP